MQPLPLTPLERLALAIDGVAPDVAEAILAIAVEMQINADVAMDRLRFTCRVFVQMQRENAMLRRANVALTLALAECGMGDLFDPVQSAKREKSVGSRSALGQEGIAALLEARKR